MPQSAITHHLDTALSAMMFVDSLDGRMYSRGLDLRKQVEDTGMWICKASMPRVARGKLIEPMDGGAVAPAEVHCKLN